MGQSSWSHEKNVVIVVGTTSTDGLIVGISERPELGAPTFLNSKVQCRVII